MAKPKKNQFDVGADVDPTAATALGDVVVPKQTSGSLVTAAQAASGQSDGPKRNVFTWKQMRHEADALEQLRREVSRELGRRVDKATCLSLLVDLANENAAVMERLLAQFSYNRPVS
jgi:hypothetical protein